MNAPAINFQGLLTSPSGRANSGPAPSGKDYESFLAAQQAVDSKTPGSPETTNLQAKAQGQEWTETAPAADPEEMDQESTDPGASAFLAPQELVITAAMTPDGWTLSEGRATASAEETLLPNLAQFLADGSFQTGTNDQATTAESAATSAGTSPEGKQTTVHTPSTAQTAETAASPAKDQAAATALLARTLEGTHGHLSTNKASAPAPVTTGFENLVSQAFTQAPEESTGRQETTGPAPANKSEQAMVATMEDKSWTALASKGNNTVSITMGDHFQEMIGLQSPRSAAEAEQLRQATLTGQNNLFGQQQGEGLEMTGPGQDLNNDLLSQSERDEAALKMAFAANQAGAKATTAAGSQGIPEQFVVETAEPGRPQTSVTNETTTMVRLPSGTQVPENQVVNHVVEKLTLHGRPGQESSTVTIKMHPEELGELRLKLEVTHDSVKAQLLASTPQSQEILERHMYRLREALQSQGLKLDNIQVSVDSGGNESAHSQLFGEQWNQTNSGRGAKGHRPSVANTEFFEEPAPMAEQSAREQLAATGRVSLKV